MGSSFRPQFLTAVSIRFCRHSSSKTALGSASPKRKVTKYVPSLRSQCGRYPRVRWVMTADALAAMRWTSWLRIRGESNFFVGAYRARRSGEPRYPGETGRKPGLSWKSGLCEDWVVL